MSLGEIVKYYRKKIGLTQQELSHGICSVPYLSKVENNKLVPSEDIANHLCLRLEIDMTLLGTLSDNSLLEELFQWYELVKKRNFYEAEEIKSKILLERETFYSSFDLVVYLDIFTQYHFLMINGSLENKGFFKEAQLKEEFMHPNQLYYFHKLRGIYHRENKEWEQSINYLEKALKIGIEIGIEESDLFYSLSIIYSRSGKLSKSNEMTLRAIQIFQTELDFARVLDCFEIIGINYLLLKEYHNAEISFQKILDNKEIGDDIKGRVLHNMGLVHYKQEKYSLANTYLLESLNLKQNDLTILSPLYLLSDIHFRLNNHEKGEEFLNFGVHLSKKISNKEYFYKFSILSHKHLSPMATEEWIPFMKKKVIPYFKNHGDRDDYSKFQYLLGETYISNKKYKEAAKLFYLLSLESGDYEEGEI